MSTKVFISIVKNSHFNDVVSLKVTHNEDSNVSGQQELIFTPGELNMNHIRRLFYFLNFVMNDLSIQENPGP